MDKVAIYNVDKPHQYDKLVIVEITSEVFPIYGESNAEDIGLSYTKPELLARLRKVLHDGSVDRQSNYVVHNLTMGDKIIVFPNGSVIFIIDNCDYRYEKIGSEEVLQYAELPLTFLDDDQSVILMTEERLNSYLDEYKLKVRSASKPSKSDGYVFQDDYHSNNNDDDILGF